WSTTARANPVPPAARARSSASCKPGARRSIARRVRNSRHSERERMAYENILVETKGRVGVIRLNRPNALNALNRALIAELTQAVEAFEADANIGCMLITGSEKAFAAGADIKEMADKTFMDAYGGNFTAEWDCLARTRKPVVAAVAGFALGGGCELAM